MDKICTSIEQSKKLIELRIDVNTADCCWILHPDGRHYILSLTEPLRDDVPAWSLSALLELLPYYILTKVKNGFIKATCKNRSYYSKVAIDAVYELLVNLKENKLI